MGAGVATVVGTVALYFLVADATGLGEAIGCAIVLVIAGPFALVIRAAATVPIQLPARGWWLLLRGCGQIPAQLWHVGRGLLRAAVSGQVEGAVRATPFRFGGIAAAEVGRRAAVGTAMSLAPNGFVLGTDGEREALLVHQLVPQPIGGDRDWPA